MNWILIAAALLAAYLIGSLPVGFFIVKVMTGKDIRQEHSGRTGGTNVLRTAGFPAGLATAIGDLLKGASAVWLARALIGGIPWVEAGAGLLAIVGHNYSIFLAKRVDGRLKLQGGAGGAPSLGAAMALWWPMVLIATPISALLLYLVGYASVATMMIGVVVTVIFVWRAILGISPWEYVAYGLMAEGLLVYALRPNIQRLLKGTERVVGLRAKGGQEGEKES